MKTKPAPKAPAKPLYKVLDAQKFERILISYPDKPGNLKKVYDALEAQGWGWVRDSLERTGKHGMTIRTIFQRPLK